MHLKPGCTLTLVTGSAVDIDVVASYHDEGSIKQALPGVLNTAITTATTTTILAGPTSGPSVTRVLDSLSVRNIDSSSNVVTVKLNDGTTNCEVRKITLAAGDALYYTPGESWETHTASASATENVVLLTADVGNANATPDTLEDVTGLSVEVDADDTYWFRAVIPYTSAATTTGSRWTVNGPAMTAIQFTSRYTLTATSETVNYIAALQGPAAANVSSLTAGNIAVLEGTFTPSAAGTFIIQHASEVAASAITAKAGATLRWQKLINA
jgi:hypothetical protein